MRHCDDYIDDDGQPECLRAFLDHVRSPAHGSLRADPRPELYAATTRHISSAHGIEFSKGAIVRVTFASRLGDVGISGDLSQTSGYAARVDLEDLTNFTSNLPK